MSLTIFKSSAGSGKTYTLSKEYLKLALRAPDYYKKILTVTFTNKASEEMKERVLTFLHGIANDAHELVRVLAQELGKSEKEITQKAQAVLRHLLHHYGFFNITTIDTFFYRIIRSFSREIGLHGTSQIELDQDKVTERLIDSLLEIVDEDEPLRQWLIDFSMYRLSSGKGYEFKSDVKSLGKQLFSEAFKALPQEAFLQPDSKTRIKKTQTKLHCLIYSFESKLQKIGHRFFQALEDNGIAPDELKGGKRSPIASFFRKLTQRNYQQLINKTVEKCLNNPEEWATKTNSKKDFTIQLANNKLIALLSDAVDTFTHGERQYGTAQSILKHLYALGLLTDLTARLQAYRLEENALMISDLPDFLSQIIKDSDTPFIYEKIGNQYAHFLIDEFQDTSAFQWNNFRALLAESMAKGYKNFVVGDAKQSIYGFRGGDPLLLTQGIQRDIPQATEETLDYNYRSAKQIIHFNNQLFAKLPALLCSLADDRLTQKGKDQILTAYRQVIQKSTKEEEGLVQVKFLDLAQEEEEKWQELAINKTIALIEHLQQEGHSLNDMAILVRTNSEAKRLVHRFIHHKNTEQAKDNVSYEVISADGMLLSASPAVQLLITALMFLQNPKNKVAEAKLAFKYLTLTHQHPVSTHQDFAQLTTKLPDNFLRTKEHLMRLPIYELIEVLIRLFKLSLLKDEYAYLQAFQDIILKFTASHRSDIPSFLKWWSEKNQSSQKPSVQMTGALNAMEILTIHKAKGLQYPIVIIPFCNFNIDSQRHLSWYKSPNNAPFNAIENIPVEYASRLTNTLMEEQYKDETAKWYQEHLNMLYVAFTRAEYALYAFCQTPSPKATSRYADMSKLLLSYFEEVNPAGWDAGTQQYRSGTLAPIRKSQENKAISLMHYPSYKWSNRLAIQQMGAHYFTPEKEQKRKEGVLLHQVLAEIRTYKDTDEVLDRYVRNLQITPEDRKEMARLFGRLWQNKQVKAWFSEGNQVKREVVVLPKDGEIKRIDRVIIDNDHATIIDFKSGNPKPQDAQQVREYIALLKAMAYRTDGYTLYLKTGEVKKVKD